MSGVNKATILGRLGQDPDTRYTQTNERVTRLSVATSSRWKDRATGEPREETEWHRCVCFGRTAEIASQYLAKGREVYLEGRLKTRKWQDQGGIDRYTTEIIVDQLILVGGRANGDSQATAPAPAQPAAQRPTPAGTQTPAPSYGNAPVDFDDDIPF
jgi:single-strand DNA-binding protein